MLPHGLVVLEALPLTHNGRSIGIDSLSYHGANRTRRRPPLARSDGSRGQGSPPNNRSSPRSPRIGVADVGIDDDFFERGGDSLSAMIMMMESRTSRAFSIPPGALFEDSTPPIGETRQRFAGHAEASDS